MITTLNVDEEMGTVRYEVVYVVIFIDVEIRVLGCTGLTGSSPPKIPIQTPLSTEPPSETTSGGWIRRW